MSQNSREKSSPNGPEGFDPAKVDELLGLAGRKETAQLVVLFGYRKDDGNADRPKSRLPLDRIVTKL